MNVADDYDDNSDADSEQGDDIVQVAKNCYQADESAWSEVYNKAREDLEFLSDEPYAQWQQQVYTARLQSGQQVLSIDQLSQFVHQVVNDIRQNTPSIAAIPANDDADVPTADIFKGLIRGIEYQSNADDVYDTAANYSVKSSIGFIRVDHDYADDMGFEQDLCIKRVINPLTCWIDSNSIECDGRDAQHATILEDVTVTEFKRRWPKYDPSDFSGKKQKNLKNADTITVAEFFRIEEDTKTIAQTDDGNLVEDDSETDYKTKRVIKKTKVMRYWVSGQDVLESGKFPGKYIPIVPVYGEEAWINGKRNIFSLIRKSKDVQMMFNLWASLETDLLLKQPNAPVMVAAGSIENYKDDWLNPSKSMALRYDQVMEDGSRYDQPQRLQPPTIPTGIVNAKRETLDDIKATLGMYNASIGQRSNETSGVAIANRAREGDVATYHFADNLNRSITQVGRILVSAIPEIYDTPRIIRIIGLEDEPKQVGINGQIVPGQEQQYDLTKGKYDVRVTTGASYTTKRQETVAALQSTFQAQPELMQILGDIYFKNSDFAGAQAMAERMKKVIDKSNPGLTEDGAEAPNPQMLQMQGQLQQAQSIIQQGAQEIQQLQQQLQSKQAENAFKAQDSQTKSQLDAAKLQQQQQQMQLDAQIKQMELELKQQELQLKQQELEMEALQMQQQPSQDIMTPGFKLPEGLQITKTPEAEAREQEMMQAQMMAEQQEEQARQIQIQQNQMVIEAVTGVQSSVQQLAAAINQPRRVIYAEDGKVEGIQ